MVRHEFEHDDSPDRWARLRAPKATGRVLGRWSPSVSSRVFGVVCCALLLVFGTVLLVDGAETGDRVPGAVMLVIAPVVYWLVYARPCLVLTDEEVVVQNPFVAFVVPLADVQHAEAGGWGVLIAVRGRHAPVTAMAVAKANISFMAGRKVRADQVADAISRAAREAALPPVL